jgi:predicted ATPase/class 3 adenylate cyclase
MDSDHPSRKLAVILHADIVGSTALVQLNESIAHTRVQSVFNAFAKTIVAYGGIAREIRGDALLAEFDRASDAVAGALAFQVLNRKSNDALDDEIRPRVRIGISLGEVVIADNTITGAGVVLAQRLEQLSEPDGVIVQGAVADTVPVRLPFEFESLGEHVLKGFDQPVRAFVARLLPGNELPAPEVTATSKSPIAGRVPALSGATVSNPTNLPTPLSELVGRQKDLASIRHALTANRLVTLTGAGGCGKTRLAVQAGAAERVDHVDGVWFVELGLAAKADLVTHAIAGVFGLREELGRPMVETLKEQLQAVRTLLVVDNCEHVLTSAATTLEQLLEHCPGLRVLATSREPLGLVGEAVWQVPSLDKLAAAELFVQRAQSSRTGFIPTDDETSIIAEIVERLDGIPLAIELAAARVRMMDPARIAAAIDDRFRLLTGGSRTAMARQRTLEASVAWSYDLLDDAEKLLGRRLAVMHSFTLEAAQDIGSDEQLDPYAVLDVLTSLVDKSMVQVDHSGTGYRFLETIRQYLQRCLIESGEAEHVRMRHLEHFVELAERCAPVMSFRDSSQLLAMLETEHGNLETALEFANESGHRELALRLATALTLFWELRGHLGRAGRWFARLLEQPDAGPSKYRARACWGAAHIALYGGDIATMSVRAPEALELAELVDDDWARARALNTVGFATAMFTPAEARAGLMRSVELGERTGDDWSVVDSWKMISVSHWVEHNDAAAAESIEAVRVIGTRLGAGYFLAWYHGLVGFFLAHRGDLPQARVHLGDSIRICDAIGEPVTGGLARCWLMSVDIAQGNYERVHAEATTMLRHAHASGNGFAIPALMARLGEVALARGDARGVVDLLGPFVKSERESGIPYLVAVSALVLASAQRQIGDLSGATALLADISSMVDGFGNDWMMARLQLQQARIALEVGDLQMAEQLTHSSLATFVRMGQLPDLPSVFDMLGFLANAAGRQVEAVCSFSAADALRANLGTVALPPEAASVRDACDGLRATRGPEVFTAHWNKGAALTLDEYVATLAVNSRNPH